MPSGCNLGPLDCRNCESVRQCHTVAPANIPIGNVVESFSGYNPTYVQMSRKWRLSAFRRGVIVTSSSQLSLPAWRSGRIRVVRSERGAEVGVHDPLHQGVDRPGRPIGVMSHRTARTPRQECRRAGRQTGIWLQNRQCHGHRLQRGPCRDRHGTRRAHLTVFTSCRRCGSGPA